MAVAGVGLGIAAYEWSRVPHAALLPALLGLIPYTLGKYLICPLRWHWLSASGQSRRWHLRVNAEGEVLGFLSPAHAGADLWRIHMLRKVGLDRPAAVVDVALDRLVGAFGTGVFAVAAGVTLPARLLAVAGGGALLVGAGAIAVRRRAPKLLRGRRLPAKRHLVRGIGLSMAYQFAAMGLLLGTTAAVGHTVSPVALFGVFGASQLAGVVPGIHGAGPREGALVAGLVALGVPLGAAVGAISLSAMLVWVPALALGGTAHLHRRWSARGGTATA